MDEKDIDEQGTRQKSDFADRLLSVFEVIARQGPLSLKQLIIETGIPKASAWRSAQILKDKGWVRVRLADGFFEVAPHFDDIMAESVVAVPEVNEIPDILEIFVGGPPVSIAVGIFWSYGHYKEIETTRAGEVIGGRLSLVNDFQTTAALFMFSQDEIIRHLRAYTKYSSEDERRLVESGERMSEVMAQAKSSFVVWSEDKSQFAFPWLFKSGVRGAVRVFPRKENVAAIEALNSAHKRIMDLPSTDRWWNRKLDSVSTPILRDWVLDDDRLTF